MEIIKLSEEAKRIARLLWDTKGPRHQSRILSEECCELSVSLHHLCRGRGEGRLTPEEMGDVLFVMFQVIDGLGLTEKVLASIEVKARREEGRLLEQIGKGDLDRLDLFDPETVLAEIAAAR